MKEAPETAEKASTVSEPVDSKNEKKGVYTMPGVLHFLEHETRNYEKERTLWNFERIELLSRISSLKGELHAQDTIKAFLVKRIKMLESTLRRERIARSKSTNELESLVESTDDDDEFVTVPVHLDPPAFFGDQRKILADFVKEMQEIGLMIPEDLEGNEDVKEEEEAPEDGNREAAKTDDLLENSFKFLAPEKNSKPKSIDQMKKEYRDERERQMEERKREKEEKSEGEGSGSPPLTKREPSLQELINATRESTSSDNSDADLVWKVKRTLRSHLDAVRAIQFHPLDPLIFTASEDGTVKMWFLSEKGAPLGDYLVPVCTMRGHKGPVLSLVIDDEGQNLYSGGADGYICYWNMPAIADFKDIRYGHDAANNLPYDKFSDASAPALTMAAHKDAVWSIALAADRVVSASSDGTVRIAASNEPDVYINAPAPDVGKPISVNIMPDTDGHVIVAYQHHCVVVLSWDTGLVVRSFNFGSEKCTLMAIATHPTLPVTVVASTDRKVRLFNNENGEMTHSFVAHTDVVSCLTIENSQLLITGCHDGSIRIWDFERKVCLQEIKAHRTKGDGGVYGIAYHNHYQMIGSAGADGLAKVLLP